MPTLTHSWTQGPLRITVSRVGMELTGSQSVASGLGNLTGMELLLSAKHFQGVDERFERKAQRSHSHSHSWAQVKLYNTVSRIGMEMLLSGKYFQGVDEPN